MHSCNVEGGTRLVKIRSHACMRSISLLARPCTCISVPCRHEPALRACVPELAATAGTPACSSAVRQRLRAVPLQRTYAGGGGRVCGPQRPPCDWPACLPGSARMPLTCCCRRLGTPPSAPAGTCAAADRCHQCVRRNPSVHPCLHIARRPPPQTHSQSADICFFCAAHGLASAHARPHTSVRRCRPWTFSLAA